MNDEQVRLHVQAIRRRIAALQNEDVEAWKEIDAALEELHIIYEEMQTNLEAAEVVEEELLQQNQQLAERYYQYHDLFESSPIAYLVTDAHGLILEANQAIAQLLNVPRPYLVGKPLAVYVTEGDRPNFRAKLNQLAQVNDIQIWQINLCPREEQPFVAQLHVAIARNRSGLIELLQIGVYNISRDRQTVAQLTQQQYLEANRAEATQAMPRLPQSLDGLQVLIVDDEADAREFIAAVLESHGIRVTAVATAAAALEALERFRPDVLVCDVRMPDTDGYSLIRQIRGLEAQHGRHIPAAALTAYLDENREKALSAGFEAHLHKLAQPNELIEMVVQLAERGRKF